MKDRLRDLRALQGEEDNSTELVTLIKNGKNGKNGENGKTPPTNFLDDFFTQVTEMQQTLFEVKKHIQEIKTKHQSILSSPNPDSKLRVELEDNVHEVQTTLTKLKVDLKRIDKSVKERDSSEDMTNDGGAELRIRKNQQASLSRELMAAMTDFDTIQKEYLDSCKSRIKRQLQIVNPHAPLVEDVAFERMLSSDDTSIFTQGVIGETQQAKNSLRDIEQRHNDILGLESSIRQLHELFTDVAFLVQGQGEMVDNIAFHAEGALEYVERAVKETDVALGYARKARKKKIMCAVCGVVLLAALICVVYFAAK